MDFATFRESGDLSDITVLVNEVEFKLHKFPLYAKSDYFRNLTRDKDSKAKVVTLEDFPGGAEMFALVADFCYNMSLPLTRNNVVQLRGAASLLQMEGSGNLADLTDKFLHDTITSAKLNRSIQSIVTLLLNCGNTGPLADKTGVVSSCVDALIECWLKPPTKFSAFTSKKNPSEDKTTCGLFSLPVEWFVKILVKAQEEGVRMSELATLAVQYVSKAIEYECPAEIEAHPDDDTENHKDTDSGSSEEASPERHEADVAVILDAVLLALPEESYTLPYITPEWLTKVLKIATTHSCSCRNLLVKVAGEMLSTLSAKDLCIISPSVIHDIVIQASGDKKQSEQACKLVDTYITEMANKAVLTSETFKLLMSASPTDGRADYNKVYDVLEYVLAAEKEKLSEEETKELIGLVNFSQLNEVNLQKAYDTESIPKENVAKGSLALCHRLRVELDTGRYRSIINGDPPRKTRDFTKVFTGSKECLKTGADSEDAMKAATDVLFAARSKLAGPLYSSYRHYYSHPSGASHVPSTNPFNSSLDEDTSFEDEFNYRYNDRDRSYRNVDSRSRPRPFDYTNQSTYFPYSSRY